MAARRGLGTATQAGPKTGLLGFRGGPEEGHVLGSRRMHWTDWPAIDPRGADGREENPIVATVAADVVRAVLGQRRRLADASL